MEPRIGRASAGFTLIELMIVVTILSLLTLSITLGLSSPRGDRVQDWARFAALHKQLRAQAVLSGDVLGLAVDGEGYQRMAWRDGAWQTQGSRARWRDPVLVLEPADLRAPVIFGPGGQSTKVNLRFGRGSATRACTSDGWVPVSCNGA